MEMSKEAIAKVYEDFESFEIIEKEHYFEITSYRINNPSLLFLIMSYGGYAKIISSKALINELLKNAEKIKFFYKGDNDCP